MKKIFGVLLSILCMCCIAIGLTGCSNNGHVHSFDKQVISEEYLASSATCTEKATYYYSCSCGEKGAETFTSGNALGHSFTNYVSDNNATCEQDGTKTAKCVRYGTGGCMATDTVTDTGSKLGHLFEDYASNNDATYERDGTKTAKCVRYDQCGETHTIPDEGSRRKRCNHFRILCT